MNADQKKILNAFKRRLAFGQYKSAHSARAMARTKSPPDSKLRKAMYAAANDHFSKDQLKLDFDRDRDTIVLTDFKLPQIENITTPVEIKDGKVVLNITIELTAEQVELLQAQPQKGEQHG